MKSGSVCRRTCRCISVDFQLMKVVSVLACETKAYYSPGHVPSSPTLLKASTVDPDHFVTPSSSAVNTPGSVVQALAHRQHVMHQNAIRALQNQTSHASNNENRINPPEISPAVLQSLMVAAKNGNLDLGSPALKHMKNILMQQQQQQQQQQKPGLGAAIPGVASSVNSLPSQVNAEQNSELLGTQQKTPSDVSNNVPVNMPGAPQATIGNNRPLKLWSGDVAWTTHHPAGQQNGIVLFRIVRPPLNSFF